MSTVSMCVRLTGEFGEVDRALEGYGTISVFRRGDPRNTTYTRVQPIDVLIFPLIDWDSYEGIEKERKHEDLQSATRILRDIAPILARIDRSECRVELYVSTIREEEEGGIDFPAELVAAVADGGLSIGVSLMVAYDDSREDETV